MSKEQEIIRQWIEEMKANAKEHIQRKSRDPADEFESGAVSAYYEMISSLQNLLKRFGLELQEYVLDFDPDRELL
ncbi:hypothetical protein [Kyrpidia tusciae]|nr:hypothetical protein [Kyrpidia tusciae]